MRLIAGRIKKIEALLRGQDGNGGRDDEEDRETIALRIRRVGEQASRREIPFERQSPLAQYHNAATVEEAEVAATAIAAVMAAPDLSDAERAKLLVGGERSEVAGGG